MLNDCWLKKTCILPYLIATDTYLCPVLIAHFMLLCKFMFRSINLCWPTSTDHLTLSFSGEAVVTPPQPPTVKPKEHYLKTKDCLDGNGETYSGDMSVTLGGHSCLQWSAAEVQALIKGKGLLPQVQLVKHHCRNPDGDMEGPWCYVKGAGNITIDYCDLELCGEWTVLPSTKTHIH